MAKLRNVTGMEAVIAKMRAVPIKLAKDNEVGLKRAGLFIQRESMKEVPVEFGNLRQSAFTRAEGKGWNIRVTVGYTAGYALHVHENLEMKLRGQPRPSGKGKYWSPPRGKNKFLEDPIRDNIAKIRKIVAIGTGFRR